MECGPVRWAGCIENRGVGEGVAMNLEVFLRQSREYVQGTQIIARSAENLAESGWFFEQAIFSSITNRVISICASCNGQKENIGRVTFSKGDASQLFYLQESDTLAPRYDTPMLVKVAFVAEKEGTVTYRYESAPDFEGLLNAMVQTVKAEHERVFLAAYDIWLTGFRGFKIPVDILLPCASGIISLCRGRIMGGDGVFQTLWMLTARDDQQGQIASGTVTFAFKSKEALLVY